MICRVACPDLVMWLLRCNVILNSFKLRSTNEPSSLSQRDSLYPSTISRHSRLRALTYLVSVSVQLHRPDFSGMDSVRPTPFAIF